MYLPIASNVRSGVVLAGNAKAGSCLRKAHSTIASEREFNKKTLQPQVFSIGSLFGQADHLIRSETIGTGPSSGDVFFLGDVMKCQENNHALNLCFELLYRLICTRKSDRLSRFGASVVLEKLPPAGQPSGLVFWNSERRMLKI
jgi:hypothetical protein